MRRKYHEGRILENIMRGDYLKILREENIPNLPTMMSAYLMNAGTNLLAFLQVYYPILGLHICVKKLGDFW